MSMTSRVPVAGACLVGFAATYFTPESQPRREAPMSGDNGTDWIGGLACLGFSAAYFTNMVLTDVPDQADTDAAARAFYAETSHRVQAAIAVYVLAVAMVCFLVLLGRLVRRLAQPRPPHPPHRSRWRPGRYTSGYPSPPGRRLPHPLPGRPAPGRQHQRRPGVRPRRLHPRRRPAAAHRTVRRQRVRRHRLPRSPAGPHPARMGDRAGPGRGGQPPRRRPVVPTAADSGLDGRLGAARLLRRQPAAPPQIDNGEIPDPTRHANLTTKEA